MTWRTRSWGPAGWLLLVLPVALAVSPARGQTGRLAVAAHGGFTLGLDDSPPYAVLRGLSVSARTDERWRVGIEYMDANMFGPTESHESHAWMLTPVVEYGFASSGRVRPFLSFGVGLTQWRSLIGDLRSFDSDELVYDWDRQHGINLAGGLGVRIYLTKRLYLSPEARIGLLPSVRTSVALGYSFF